jgi:hypothetical protein
MLYAGDGATGAPYGGKGAPQPAYPRPTLALPARLPDTLLTSFLYTPPPRSNVILLEPPEIQFFWHPNTRQTLLQWEVCEPDGRRICSWL